MTIKFNFQNDPLWRNDTMQGVDKFGAFGCLQSTLANIIQDFRKEIYTPKIINKLVKNNNWYFISNGLTSFLKTEELLKHFNLQRFEIFDKQVKGHLYYYARVILGGVGHYINILAQTENHYIGYDVYDGITKLYSYSEIKNLYGVLKMI